MRASVDSETCIGCGVCVETCSSVFEMDGSVAVVKANPVPGGAEASCREAVEACPVTAIALEE